MIEINLLPEESKVKVRRAGKISIESKYFFYLVPIAFAVLILAHICLAAGAIVKTCQFKALQSKWNKLQPQRESLDNLKKEISLFYKIH